MGKQIGRPDYLFEISWEVCNKIGGIHTVISTKALSILEELGDKYMVIGPDVWRDSEEHPEFLEDNTLFADWIKHSQSNDFHIRVGRWKIKGSPIAILIDFTQFFTKKDEIFSKFWELFRLDSIAGQWDYVEPTLFGYATGKVIESYINFYGLRNSKVAAHFHEWMTGAGLLYLTDSQPQVGTVFTTHATVVGRSLAGNNMPLYSVMQTYNGDEKARELNLVAKQSLEKIAAGNAKAFTTVSEITAKECAQLLEKQVDLITPNGFEDSIVPDYTTYKNKRKIAREKLLKVASLISGEELPNETFIIGTSGRYEYHNKGLDIFLDAMGSLNQHKNCPRKAVAFIMVPANHYGPRKDLQDALADLSVKMNGDRFLTHYLHYPEHDSILQRIKANGISNSPEDAVKVIFVPSYLNGSDGILDLDYYDALMGFDISVFPSYYEPWGYTPMESLAFSIPTVTTSLAGFGLWVNEQVKEKNNAITVIPRTDDNDEEVVKGICDVIAGLCGLTENRIEETAKAAVEISKIALWENLVEHYWKAYEIAFDRAESVEPDYFSQERVKSLPSTTPLLSDVEPVWRRIVIQQHIPDRLIPLEELSRNLWWSWNKEAVDLFKYVDPELWELAHNNPIVMLERIPFEILENLEKDKDFLKKLDEVYESFQAYMNTPKRENEPSIAYFSMEFGLHHSLKIYSGGLGLLAGDYLKEASDYNYSMVGVGLLYRYGYFRQVITAGGSQVAHDDFQDFSRIPVTPVKDANGNFITISVVLPGRNLNARIWKAQVGRIPLYLLDADIEANRPGDRQVTHKLYGGDHENRFKQELLLGIGGVRVLRALGINSDLYHLNEGHAAFTGFERLREYIQGLNMTYPEARETVRATSLFTTHTPVPAGHDAFDENMMRTYMSHYPGRLSIDWNQLMSLGRVKHDDMHEKFSMSVLAMNLSQEVNGVSKLHGQVSREMFSDMYKGYLAEESHIGYVTNGVHLSTWISDRWRQFYLKEFGEDFLEVQEDRSRWNRIKHVKNEEIWDIRKEERKELITYIRNRLKIATTNFLEDPGMAIEIANSLDENALTIGFARRFATYKRAHLLFTDLDRLAKIVNNPDRPIQFIFAGKAHPKDIPGQELIKRIVEISKMPAFVGKILFLQNYDIALAKKLLHGVDIWLNTPTRPLEASGTSGEKAVMNGGLHFSVLDGWWAEGYKENAGWALPMERAYNEQGQQDELDSEIIYSMLENDIAPKFYTRDKNDIPDNWVNIIKNSISRVAPEFTMNRMLRDYIDRFYSKLYHRSKKLIQNDYRLVREISVFKKQIIEKWTGISVIEIDFPDLNKVDFVVGKTYSGSIKLNLNGLSSEHIGLELVMIESEKETSNPRIIEKKEMVCEKVSRSESVYSFEYEVRNTGQFDIGFRVFPKMEYLPHRMDLPLVKWV